MPPSKKAIADAAVRRNVKRLMAERGWGPTKLARASGYSVRTIQYILKGETTCTVGTLAELAHGLGVEAEELLK